MAAKNMRQAGDDALIEEVREDGEKLTLFKRWFENSYRSFEPWRRRAIESRKFVQGDQWSEQDDMILRESGRPRLVINRILGPVMFLAGIFTQSRTEPQLLPQETGDALPAQLMNELYKWVGNQSREARVDEHVFMDKCVTGLGYWKLAIDFEKSLEGEIEWQAPDPLAIFPDPNFLDHGWKNADYVCHATWMNVRQAQHEFPEHSEVIRHEYGEWIAEAGGAHTQSSGTGEETGDTMADQRHFWDPNTQRLRVIEIQYKVRLKVSVAIGPDGSVISDPDEVTELRKIAKHDDAVKENVQFARVPVTRVRHAHMLGNLLLDDEESPYDMQDFSIFPDIGYYFWREPFGVVEPMKDPQREKNKRRSTMVEMVQRAALSGFFNKKEGGANSRDLEDYAAGVAKVINYDQVPPNNIQPPDIPQSLLGLEQMADRDLQVVTNLNAELMGNTTQKTVSGRAIEARQRSGIMVQEPLLAGTREAKILPVRFAVGLIQQFFSIPKAMRILGVQAERLQAQGQAEGFNQMMEQIGTPEDVAEMLKGAFNVNYDVVVGHRPFEPSIKMHQMNVVMEMMEKFPGFIPPDVATDIARDSGIITEQTARRIKDHIAMMMQQPQPGAGPAPLDPPTTGPNGEVLQ